MPVVAVLAADAAGPMPARWQLLNQSKEEKAKWVVANELKRMQTHAGSGIDEVLEFQ